MLIHWKKLQGIKHCSFFFSHWEKGYIHYKKKHCALSCLSYISIIFIGLNIFWIVDILPSPHFVCVLGKERSRTKTIPVSDTKIDKTRSNLTYIVRYFAIWSLGNISRPHIHTQSARWRISLDKIKEKYIRSQNWKGHQSSIAIYFC